MVYKLCRAARSPPAQASSSASRLGAKRPPPLCFARTLARDCQGGIEQEKARRCQGGVGWVAELGQWLLSVF
jgi:hypothetical protein